jgi:outer membrane protein assembly factor BamB
VVNIADPGGRSMNRCRAILVALLALAPAAPAQQADGVRLPRQVESEQTYKRLVEAERKLIAGKAAEAADDLQRILDEAGDDLVSADSVRYRPARQVAQLVLAKLPAEVLRGYRDRTDGPARRLLEAGKKNHDPRPLRQLLDRYFASRPAESALLLLGELAFERGDFRAAEGYWRRLLPGANPSGEPSFPDPKADPATVRARVILAAIFAGERDRARRELKQFRRDFPKATGHLAGRDGPFADTLQALLARPPVVAAAHGDGEWTAFAGSAAHAGRANGRLPYYWPGGPTWTARLPGGGAGRVGSTKSVAFHPVALNGVAYVADAVRVFGFDLRTGRRRFAYDLRADEDAAKAITQVRVQLPLRDAADFTLTAARDRLFARLGVPTVAPPSGVSDGPTSLLVCFAPPARATEISPPLEVRWKLAPPESPAGPAAWEGAPVWAEGRLYAVLARFDGTRLVQSVACYDDPPGKPLWVADLCDAPQSDARTRQQLLTYADGKLVFCSQTGVVVALDATTGKAAWAFRYPKAARPPASGSPRDLCPPLAHGGRVFVAPADADRVFALDTQTGRTLWQAGPFQVAQLLGVSRGRLVCTLAAPVRGIRGLSVENGSYREPDGWMIHDDPMLRSYGRGLVSDDLILWPTQNDLFLLSPEDGLPVRPPIRKPHGNLAFADGVLIVATPTEVWGYVSGRVELPARKDAAAAHPDDPERARQLAHAYADAGRWADAARALRHAEPAADPARTRAEWLSDRAERALEQGQPDAARALLRQALNEQLPQDWRARAAGRLLTLEPPGGGGDAADQFFNALQQPADFAARWVLGPDGVPVQLRDLAARHFAVGVTTPPPAARPVPPTAVSFDLASLPRLEPNTTVVRETLFPSVRCRPLLPFAGRTNLPGLGAEAGREPRLLVADDAHVFAYRPDEDQPAWSAALPDGLIVTHAALVDNAILAAGPRGVVRLARADGRLRWAFRLPDADPLPSRGPLPTPRSADVPTTRPGLSDFALAGPRLLARLGEHHLLSLDVESGQIAWLLDTRREAKFTPFPFPSAPRFARPFFADGQVAIVHVSTGQRWSIQPNTGAVARVATSSPVPWVGPPVRVGRRVAVPDGPARVRALDPSTSQVVWSFDAGREASLTGRPPRLRAVSDGLLVAVSRNHGVEIERLLGLSGTRSWRSGPALITAGDIDWSTADTDYINVLIPAEGQLTALRLDSGRVAWTTDLTAEVGGLVTPWRVRAGRKAVLAYPAQPIAPDPPGAVAWHAAGSFLRAPGAARLPVLAAGLYDAWASRTVPLLFLDPETGRARHRLDLPAAGPALGVHLDPSYKVVVTAGKAYWLK